MWLSYSTVFFLSIHLLSNSTEEHRWKQVNRRTRAVVPRPLPFCAPAERAPRGAAGRAAAAPLHHARLPRLLPARRGAPPRRRRRGVRRPIVAPGGSRRAGNCSERAPPHHSINSTF